MFTHCFQKSWKPSSGHLEAFVLFFPGLLSFPGLPVTQSVRASFLPCLALDSVIHKPCLKVLAVCLTHSSWFACLTPAWWGCWQQEEGHRRKVVKGTLRSIWPGFPQKLIALSLVTTIQLKTPCNHPE